MRSNPIILVYCFLKTIEYGMTFKIDLIIISFIF